VNVDLSRSSSKLETTTSNFNPCASEKQSFSNLTIQHDESDEKEGTASRDSPGYRGSLSGAATPTRG
jgi:hypothetical protein